MRHRLNKYTIVGNTIELYTDVTIEDIRLIVNETQGVVICSSMQKNNIDSVTTRDTGFSTLTIPTSVCELVEGDKLTIEIDKGDSIDTIKGDNQEATNSAILSALNGVSATMYKGVPIVSQIGDATISPNVLNVWGEISSLNITKGNDIDGITNLYLIRFVAGENLKVEFTGFDLLWHGGSTPAWKAGSTYEINIVDNLALWAEFTPSV